METNEKPLIKYFRIDGLHGYKDVEIDFQSPVRIVIAENGAGKTTILSALHSFLTGNFYNLRNIDFESISCSFEGIDKEVTLKKKSIIGTISSSSSKPHAVQQIFDISDVDEMSFQSFLTNEFDPDSPKSIRESQIGEQIYIESPFSLDDLYERFVEAREFYELSMDEESKNAAKKVKEAIGETEILYLPTYRRIEKLLNSKKTEKNRADWPPFRNRPYKNSLPLNSHMNYGLADVEDRLSELTDTVQRRTNFGYREISANIIDDLLEGKTESPEKPISELPDLETLTRFFSRIGGRKQGRAYDLVKIQQIYNEEIPVQDNNITTLRYFLSKLSQVVNQTKKLESTIETFVEKANTYLGNTSDVKSLSYDPENMKVSVINEWTSREVKLNDLSSGEKQVVSLLSYLFLYPSEKIILVDEPELSLSIDWQQKILVDMVAAPSCRQLLAITHSPFIFDNVLDCYGSPLKITRRTGKEI